ncbi:hypothetical protein [Spiroplasma endosymbiont of Seladonia tumulorum]|uniref:hypothetical protein n=1 Tax=Spiroplasma endosymbiont of Seladonia tumulorum TaxID=3066321 RepID=UPI0030D3005E
MKKLNKTCIKKRYWGYCFHKECNQENKLSELMLKSYSVSFENIADEHWALNTKKN